MAKVVWHCRNEQDAFRIGFDAAANHQPRTAPSYLRTYNERAAFNDGWDTYRGPKSPATLGLTRRAPFNAFEL